MKFSKKINKIILIFLQNSIDHVIIISGKRNLKIPALVVG